MRIIATRVKTGGGTEQYEIFSEGGRAGGYSTPVISSNPIYQTQTGCRWREAKKRNSGNTQTTITFTTHQTFTSHDLAAKERLEVGTRYEGLWNVIVYLGNKTMLYWLKNAVIVPVPETQIGVDCIVHWNISGGRLRKTLSDNS